MRFIMPPPPDLPPRGARWFPNGHELMEGIMAEPVILEVFSDYV